MCSHMCLPHADKSALAARSPTTRKSYLYQLLAIFCTLCLALCLHLTQSTAITMAPLTKYLCPCFKCNSKKQLAKRTIQIHFRENSTHLDHLRASGAQQDTIAFVQGCHYQITQLLNSLEESQSSGQSGSPYPDGEYLLNCLLIQY
jgi:hypothetical protein